MIKNGIRLIHPREILRDDYLNPLGISVNGLGKALHIKPCRVNHIVREIRGLIPDTAPRLTGDLGGDTLSWMKSSTGL